ncbi:DNA adenine methylase [Bacillus subtilis]|uniref:DNA adenine methylase n=1 Tax=Bacillus subtilis TaxID=1423 RepID=UPI0015E65A71|nr:DNA adenine methylase [Bacillus subtilis]
MANKIKSPLRWVGGKSKLLNKIIPLIPEHKGFVEVFGGSAVVLLNKEQSKWEVLNDYDSNLANFWSVIQNAKEQFLRSFEYEIVSRERFNEYKTKYQNNDFEDAIERAKIFYYLVRSCFASDMKNPVFGASKDRNRLRIDKIEDDIEAVYNRFVGVTVENKSFEDIFKIYDSENTFLYLDPPYRNTKQYATGKFTDDQYRMLRDCCFKAEGKWLLTINNDPYIKELFKDFHIVDHNVWYSVCKTDNGRADFKELLISNYNFSDIKS